MGGCVGKSSFTVTEPRNARLRGIHPFMFSSPDAEVALLEAGPGEYLLYRDFDTDKVVLSVRMPGYIRHYRIHEVNKLYYLEGQPYAYLDSIVYYHQKHKLNGAKLIRQANLSARVVRGFAHKIARSNGNVNDFADRNFILGNNGLQIERINESEEFNDELVSMERINGLILHNGSSATLGSQGSVQNLQRSRTFRGPTDWRNDSSPKRNRTRSSVGKYDVSSPQHNMPPNWSFRRVRDGMTSSVSLPSTPIKSAHQNTSQSEWL